MQLIDFDTDDFILTVTVAGVRRSYSKAELVEVLEAMVAAEATIGARRSSSSRTHTVDAVQAEIGRIRAEGTQPWIAKLAAVVREVAKHEPIPVSEQRRLARILDAMCEPAPEKTTSRLASTLENLKATDPSLVAAISAFVKRNPGLR